MKGRFITIEGQDGAGKSTNLAFARDYLLSRGLKVHTTREPGGTRLGESLREILLYGSDLACTDMAELLLMFAARAQHLEEVIYPKLESATWVISDRFTDATYAYQGAGRGIGQDKIAVLETLVQGDFGPDLTILLDIPLETAITRGATNGGDRFESRQNSFKQRVRDFYRRLHDTEPERVKLVDAAQSLEQVQAVIASHLERLVTESARAETGQS